MDSIVTPIVVLNLVIVGAITAVSSLSDYPRGKPRLASVEYHKAVSFSGSGTSADASASPGGGPGRRPADPATATK